MWWLLGTKEKLTEEQAAFLERLKEKSPRVEIAQSLALEFFGMARRREPAGLEGWIERAAASGIEELKHFGAGLRRDWEAVVAGLTLEWSSGPVEGQAADVWAGEPAGAASADRACCKSNIGPPRASSSRAPV